MLRPGVRDHSHRDGQLFKKRFRLPYPVYVKIMALLEAHPDFLLEDACAVGKASAPLYLKVLSALVGKASAPLYLKVLSALRVLGRGECFKLTASSGTVSIRSIIPLYASKRSAALESAVSLCSHLAPMCYRRPEAGNLEISL